MKVNEPRYTLTFTAQHCLLSIATAISFRGRISWRSLAMAASALLIVPLHYRLVCLPDWLSIPCHEGQ